MIKTLKKISAFVFGTSNAETIKLQDQIIKNQRMIIDSLERENLHLSQVIATLNNFEHEQY